MSTNLRIEVRTGEAERKRVDFAQGTPVEPFSVGSAASWAVRAGGVVGVHAYLYFDGTTLFISSVGGAPVSMGGRTVGADWEPVEVPMNIHLGGAKLAVRGPTSHRAGQPSARPQANVAVPEEDEKTQFQPQPQPIPEEDEKTEFQPVPNSMRQGPRGAALAAGPSAGVPASPMQAPPDSEATVVQRPEDVQKRAAQAAQAARAARPEPPAVAPESERTRFAPVQARVPGAPTPAAGQAPPGQAPPGPPLPAAGAPTPGAPVPGAAPMPGAPMPGAPMPQGSPMGAAPAPMAGGAPGPAGPGGVPGFVIQPGQPGAAPGAGVQQKKSGNPQLAKVKAQVAKAWREASIPQKAILILLPFAFFAMFTLMGQSEHKPIHHSANSVSSVAAAPPSAQSAKPALSAPPAAGSAVAATSAAPPPATAKPAAPAHTTASHGGKTLERVAVDAVAAGNYKEALEKYQALAAAHPDRPVFKQAVQILEQKLAQQ